MHYSSPHKFHIPVMGLAYTIDTPIKVARFGISSVISIVEDRLIEMMRSHYYSVINKEYLPINTSETDYRAKRIKKAIINAKRAIASVNAKPKMANLNNSSFKEGFLEVPSTNAPNTVPIPTPAPAKPIVANPAPINLAACNNI